MIKKIITGCTAASLVVSLATTAFAKTEDTSAVDCAITYASEMDTFVASIVAFHGFSTSLEGIKDIFARNVCQAYDILMLEKQQNKVIHNIQNNYLTCKKSKIPPLETAYYKLDAEIYYIRHLVKTPFFNWRGIVPFGLGDVDISSEEELEELQKNTFEDRDRLYSGMKTKYIDKVGGKKEFDSLFTKLEVKYSARKTDYIICKEKGYGWEKVVEKWDEFIDTWGGLKEGAMEAAAEIAEGAKKIERTALDNAPSSFGDFLGKTFDANLNGVPLEEGIAEIAQEYSKYKLGTPTPDLSTLLNRASSEGERYAVEIDYAKLKSKYESLYRYTTDAAVREFLASLDELQKAIQDSTIQLSKVFNCAQKMNWKQCP